MKEVQLGFVEKCESWELESRFFPSKIGGKPAWLDLKNLPEYNQITCEYCENPCIFLCQIYAPREEKEEEEEEAYHRTLFVFICRNAACCKANKNGNLKVFRSQLKMENEFYPSYRPEEDKNWRTDIQIERWRKTCHVCGFVAKSHCSKCKKTNYCSRAHQIIDWKNDHKKVCGSGINNESRDILFPEFQLVIEEEGEADDVDDDEGDDSENEENEIISKENSEQNLQKMEAFNKLMENCQLGSLQNSDDVDSDLPKFANAEEDKSFLKFMNRIRNNKDQVIRYEKGGSPLYMSSSNQAQNIPKCEECNAERQFEFQIMPHLIDHLNFEDSFRSLDWGILAIFTCKRSCVPKAGYASEYIWKQDITE